MKTILSLTAKIVTTAFIAYVGFFFVWAILIAGCEQEHPGQCGGDLMTKAVQTIYRPVFAAIVQP
jgi:hypothetical protein